MAWMDAVRGDSLSWLLEQDDDNPGVRYMALRDLLDASPEDRELAQAQERVMGAGPVAAILAAQEEAGYWVKPGPGYAPKYTGTLHSIYFLSQLGADGADPRVRRGCAYVLENALAPRGGYSANGNNSGLVHCLEGNLVAALTAFGYMADQRHRQAVEWLARSVTGEGIALAEEVEEEVRYLRSGNCAPGFCCSANNRLPCAWGAVKAMLGLAAVPEAERTPVIQRAMDAGAQFLLSRDPAVADYPMGYAEKPSRSWFQFGYPLGYVTDVLQNLEALTALGLGRDPRLSNAVEQVLSKQDSQGRWKMEYTYNGKMWADVEHKGQPSKWVTLRALRVLKQVGAG